MPELQRQRHSYDAFPSFPPRRSALPWSSCHGQANQLDASEPPPPPGVVVQRLCWWTASDASPPLPEVLMTTEEGLLRW